jgi:hypothetical protein
MGGWGNTTCGFEHLRGTNVGDPGSPTRREAPDAVRNGQRYTSVVQVRKGSITALINGKVVSHYKTDYSDLALSRDWMVGGSALGLATDWSPTVFHVVEVTEISGPGRVHTPELPSGEFAPRMTPALGRKVNLLPVIDPVRDAVRGTWKIGPDGITSNNEECARLVIRYQPPAEYDFRIEFTRRGGTVDVTQLLEVSGRGVIWAMGAFHNTVAGFGRVSGAWLDLNPTGVKAKDMLADGRRYESVVRVRKGGVEAYLDGRRVTQYIGDPARLSLEQNWEIPAGMLGIGSYQSPTTFHVIEVIEVSGPGKVLTPAPATPKANLAPGGDAANPPKIKLFEVK